MESIGESDFDTDYDVKQKPKTDKKKKHSKETLMKTILLKNCDIQNHLLINHQHLDCREHRKIFQVYLPNNFLSSTFLKLH